MEIIWKSFQTDRRSSFNLLKRPASHGNASHYGTKWVEKVDFVLCFVKPLNNPYQKSINRWHGQNDIVRPILPPGSDWTIWQLHVWHRWSFQVSIILLNCSWSCLGASLSIWQSPAQMFLLSEQREPPAQQGHRKTQHKGSEAQVCRETRWLLRVHSLSVTVIQTLHFLWTCCLIAFIPPWLLGVPLFIWFPKVLPNALFVPAIHTFARLPHSALKSVWPFKRCYQMLRVHWNTLNTVYLKLKVKGSITVFLRLKST